MRKRIVIVRCAKCRRKIFKYVKMCDGRLLRCYKERILEDYSLKEGKEVRCQCGNLIGIDEGPWIKMKQRAFTVK